MFGAASSVPLSNYVCSRPCQHKCPPLAIWPHRQRRSAVSSSLCTLTIAVTLTEKFKAILKINVCQQPISIFRAVPGGHWPPSIALHLPSVFPSPRVSVSSCSNAASRRRPHHDAGRTLSLKPTLLFTTWMQFIRVFYGLGSCSLVPRSPCGGDELRSHWEMLERPLEWRKVSPVHGTRTVVFMAFFVS